MAFRTQSMTLGFALAAAGLLAATQPAAAQQGRAMRYENWDRNGDGRITRDEWRGSRQSFDVADWNHDGVIAGAELRQARRDPNRDDRDDRDDGNLYQPSDRSRDRTGGGEPFDDWTLQAFRELDTNRDGRISASEWHYDRDDFRRADHNSDGVVTEREFIGEDDNGVQPGGAIADDGRFADLDTDRDNRVSRREWRGDRAGFDRLDENRDGYLTRAEMDEEAQSLDFRSLDLDHDGVVTRGEWRDSSATFSRLDRNRDGRLTAAEFDERGADATSPAGTTSQTPAYRAGYERGMADGRVAGREDKVRNQGWDLDGQRELEQADAGYRDGVGARVEYQAGYRAAFRLGYTEGYGRR